METVDSSMRAGSWQPERGSRVALMPTADAFAELLETPLPELMEAAAQRRDAQFGSRITFSPKVFVPLTMLCRDRCGYCTFAKPPARLDAPYLREDEVLALAA